jgi:hypothetical protein
MQGFWSLTSIFRIVATSCFIASGVCGLSAYAQQPSANNSPPAGGQQQGSPSDQMGMNDEEEEVAHPFFTHMGVPEAVGVFNLRLGGLATRADGRTKGDFAFHFETGLTKYIGLHVRNDSFLDRTRSEVMFQFAAVRSKNGMSGFSPIIEFEIPTRKGGGSRVNTLVGFSTALANKRAAFNQVVHYNPREDSVDASAALVVKIGRRLFPVIEILGEGMRGEKPIINLLGGLKVRMNKNLVLGFAVQAPVTNRRDFSSQLVFQPDIEWKRTQ